MADEVALIEEGWVVESGVQEALFGRPREEFTRRFLARLMRFA